MNAARALAPRAKRLRLSSMARKGMLLPLALSSVAVSVSVALTGQAYAQESQQGPQGVEEVTVTGSRIQRTSGFTSPVPVTAVTTEELTQYQPSTTMTDQLAQLPQFFQTQSAQRGGGALFGSAGGSYLDLRGFGPQRTLILLDGARVVPADRNGNVNVDNFPTVLLRSVEVVTGGASAAYGADALAGVTNFVLNRDFQGLDVNVRGGRTEVGDGNNYEVSVAGGTKLTDRWRMIGSIENQHIDQIQRDPATLGSWFKRYGIVANPAYVTGDNSQPMRLVLPNVYSTVHSPTGRIAQGKDPAGKVCGTAGATCTGPAFSMTGLQFTYDASGVTPFINGDVVGASTGNTADTQGTGRQAEIANDAFAGGPFGAEVARRNLFTAFTFDATDKLRLTFDLLGSQVESNQHDLRGIPHGTSPWNFEIFRENPYLPDSVRQAMYDQNVESFIYQKQGQVLGQAGNYDDHEEQRNQFDTFNFAVGIDKDLFDGGNWNLKVRLQRGQTRKYTAVLNELRVDREFLAMDAVEIYADRRDLDGDGIPDVVSEADHGTGIVMCNVQRYNPTQAQLQAAVAGILVPAPQGDDSLGGPEDRVPIPGPVGPDNTIRDCVPMNVLGQGNVTPDAASYVTSPKEGRSVVTQEFAETLLSGDIFKGIGAGPFSMAGGTTYRKQHFWQRGYPVELMAYGPPTNAPNIGIRGISGGYTGGSPNLHEFSTVPAIKGGYDVWEAFTEFNLPLWQSGPRNLTLDLAGRYSDYSTSGGITSWKTGLDFSVAKPVRLRGTVSRDVREPTFSERFDLQGGGGNVNDPRQGNKNVEITVTTGGNPDLKPEKADTVTTGFVLQPQKIPGFQFSADWYRIDLSDAVGQLGQQNIVNGCFLQNNQDLCSLVSLDVFGEIGTVRNVFLNIDRAKVRGIDYEVLFNAQPDFFSNADESLSFRLLAGRLLEDSRTVTAASGAQTTTDLAGTYFRPDFSAIASVRYQVGAFAVNLQQRYIPESSLADTATSGPYIQWEPGVQVAPGQITLNDATVQSKMYTDLGFAYTSDLAGGRRWRTSLTVTNLFDVDPPIVANFGQRFSSQGPGATPNDYDVYGRRYSLAFDYSF
ncbi:MAG TPA: TonB-dependent receptor [Gammaproteobacteria bacterium]|nr:TonB-dependent receptor [Gammaproteobacteria bacterium]